VIMERAPVETLGIDLRIRILLADDNQDLREYVGRLLRRWWSIEMVGDGAAALEAIRQRRPTLVLADAAMPDLDGTGWLQALRADPAMRSIPVIMLSERGTAGGDNLNANDCLMKPFSSRELIARVSARLEERFGESLPTQRPLRRILNAIDLPTAIVRRDGFTVENANRAYLDLAGGDAIGRPFAEGFLDAARAAREECARALASGAHHVTRELPIPRQRDGELEDTHWNFVFAPVKDDGESYDGHAVAIGVDVTEEVRARHQRDALAAEAIGANHAKDQFLAALGHELRNPLSPIVTGLQLMRAKGLCSHELDVVERQIGVIVRLVNDLLDVSRIGRGRIDLQKERVAIADVVARAIETMDPLLRERRHRLTLLVSASGLRVNVDPLRMAQVIANLLANAAKYSERGSEITVRAERDGQRVRLSIEDQGIGIAPGMLPHIFDPFAQDRSAVRRSRGGLGLGLAIVRSLVEANGGQVTAHSDGPGKGSTFCVDLPADDE
jgi:signal transduction histidine kinase